jgi:hypothetical protein
MHHLKLAAVVAVGALLSTAAAFGQTNAPTPDQPPAGSAGADAAPASNQATTAAGATEQTPPTPGQGVAPQTSDAATTASTASTQSAAGGPVVAWVKHVKPPTLVDTTAASAGFAMIGALAAISAGQAIVEKDNIEDPSHELAKAIATAYAASHGGVVADAPILSDKEMLRASPEALSKAATGARYVIDVDPPAMNIIYFSFDWIHYDMLYGDVVRVIDTSNGKIIAHANCFIRSEKKPGLPTHGELLANEGALLKALIARKADACLVKLKQNLKLPV